jgi:Protein of unknown function (DUF1501)
LNGESGDNRDTHGNHFQRLQKDILPPPAEQPCGPEDLHATIFHALGIDSRLEIHDRQGRPFPLCSGTTLPWF